MEEYTYVQQDIPTPEQLQARRAARIKARKERQRRRRIRRLAVAIPLVCLSIAAVIWAVKRSGATEGEPPAEVAAETPEAAAETPEAPEQRIHASSRTAFLSGELDSTYAVLIDGDSGEVLAAKNRDTVINPASMTKILTILTAADYVKDVNDTVTFTKEMSDYAYLRGLSIAGFLPGETVTLADLLYGTILPSGADAALGLAIYAAGDQDAFVALMNEKAAALGLSEAAHFSNCTGAYAEDHHCTAEDMALLLRAAMDDPLCREVLSVHVYTTSATEEHPEGLVLSNWFLRRIEDKDTGAVTVLGAKTGYVSEAGSCAASCGVTEDGHRYFCVTGNAGSAWRCIYDHVYLYKNYCG